MDNTFLEPLVASCRKMMRAEHPTLALIAAEQLLTMQVPLGLIVKYDIERLTKLHVKNKVVAGKLIRQIQILWEEFEKFERRTTRALQDPLEDREESEIGRLMLTPTKEEYELAQQKLRECNFKDMPIEDREAVEFNEPLTIIQWYINEAKRTPSPTKKETAAMRQQERKRVARRLFTPY